MSKRVQTVIGVPGRWPDRSDIVTSIASRSDGYFFAGMVMVKVGADDGFTLEVHGHDPGLRRAFSIAGRGSLADAELDAIAAHTFTLYLVEEGGSADAARRLLHAANGLLNAGGVAVKVESTGLAHRADQWAGFCADDRLGSLLRAYVTYVGHDAVTYSCGMHNLGQPDALIEADIPPSEAVNLLRMFVA